MQREKTSRMLGGPDSASHLPSLLQGFNGRVQLPHYVLECSNVDTPQRKGRSDNAACISAINNGENRLESRHYCVILYG